MSTGKSPETRINNGSSVDKVDKIIAETGTALKKATLASQLAACTEQAKNRKGIVQDTCLPRTTQCPAFIERRFMSDIDIKKMVLKYGDKPVMNGRKVTENTTVCQGCGRPVNSTDPDLQKNVGFVLTKSRSAYFFHNDCFEKVWNSPIRRLEDQ